MNHPEPAAQDALIDTPDPAPSDDPSEHPTDFRPRPAAWDEALFSRPPAAYRGAPFWSWNGQLERQRLFRQLDVYAQMGFGGGHMHSRTGLATPYLGEAFIERVRECSDEADRLGMLTWLYDEDRWPSGFAGGWVTEQPRFRTRHLRLTRYRCEPGESRGCPTHHGPPQPLSERTFIAAWALRFDHDRIRHMRRMAEDDEVGEGEVPLYAYLEVAPPWSWFNHQQYVDTLNPEAIARFIEVTHERYAAALGDRLRHRVPSIFTDEPLFRGMDRPRSVEADDDLFIAWTDDLPETYHRTFGEDLLDVFPAVLYDLADGTHARVRWRFREHHTERFSQAFSAQIADWCERHGVALTGHMMAEETLRSQSMWVGEVMRSLYHFQLPGIDMLCDRQELLTAKQAQSIARQQNRQGVLSELYGVTNWDFPFRGHLAQGNWQAAMGVTVRVPHLTWYSMAGEAKRDYPASIGEHVPWWPQYREVEDHFARLGVAMETGRPVCRVAILHPIESQWIAEGPTEQWSHVQQELEAGIDSTLRWLLEGLVDADLIAESLLPEQSPVGDEAGQTGEAALRVGKMRYEVVIVPPMLTIRRSTLDRLDAFAAAWGRIIWLGEPPSLVDAEPDDAALDLASRTHRCTLQRSALLRAVEPWREVELRHAGTRPEGVLHQLREEADGGRILFLCRTDRTRDLDNATVRLRGRWKLHACDTATGDAQPMGEAWTSDDQTECRIDLPVAGHVLLRLRPAGPDAIAIAPSSPPRYREIARLADPVPVTLHEPNVLLLDRGQWRLDNGPWQPVEEILRIDNLARRAAGLPIRHGDIAQPWVDPPSAHHHRVTVAYHIQCDSPTGPLKLALEDAAAAEVTLDGSPVHGRPEGHFVDADIQTVDLPAIGPGAHRLEITWPFGGGGGLEVAYLLGHFRVDLAGPHARLGPPVTHLAFDDATRQGLPFYGGNLTYHCELECPDEPWALCIAHFGAALVTVDSDAGGGGAVMRSPYRLEMPARDAGRIALELTSHGTRINTFGALHNCEPTWRWWGPASWRTTGTGWTDGYNLRPTGILTAPIIETREYPMS